MTRTQQSTTRALEVAEQDWIVSYGWRKSGGGWKHPNIHKSPDEHAYTLRDAVALTRADKTLGWP